MNPNSNNNNKSTDELWHYLITTMVEKIDQAKEKSDQKATNISKLRKTYKLTYIKITKNISINIHQNYEKHLTLSYIKITTLIV